MFTYCYVEGVGEDLQQQDEVDDHEPDDSPATSISLFTTSKKDKEGSIDAEFELLSELI